MRKLIDGKYVPVGKPAGRKAKAKSEGGTTSPEVAALAAKGVKSPESLTDREVRKVSASALTQAKVKVAGAFGKKKNGKGK